MGVTTTSDTADNLRVFKKLRRYVRKELNQDIALTQRNVAERNGTKFEVRRKRDGSVAERTPSVDTERKKNQIRRKRGGSVAERTPSVDTERNKR